MAPLLKQRRIVVMFVCTLCLLVLLFFEPTEEPPSVKTSTYLPQTRFVDNKKTGQNDILYEYRIFVFTYARPEGLRVTLSSILNSDYSKARGSTIDLEVFVDYRLTDVCRTRRKQAEILDILRSVSWPYGRYRIHQRYTNIGL
ncbi:uncharacterized protein TM35_000431380, partial [Trypanosoma theileri]